MDKQKLTNKIEQLIKTLQDEQSRLVGNQAIGSALTLSIQIRAEIRKA